MGLRYEDLTLAQQEFAFYLLTITESGGIDSDIKWASTNYDLAVYGDPITVAPNSYTGTEFALYGQYVRDNYPALWAEWPQTWKDDIAAHSADEYDWWMSRVITYDENETYRNAVLNNLNDAKNSIVSFFFGDSPAGLKYWIDYMTDGLGVDTNDIKTLMYYFQICVLMPQTCANVWNIVGDAPLTTIRDCAIAYLRANNSDYYWSKYGEGWTNRFTMYAWDPIIAWDGVSAPPDFGVAEGIGYTGGEIGNATASVTVGKYDKAYLANGNQDLILVDANGDKTLFRRANAGNVWISTKTTTVYTYSYNSNNEVSPDGTPSDRPPVVVSGGWPYASQLLADLRAVEGTWVYDQNKHFENPWTVQAGDCSSMVWWGVDRYDPDTAAKMTFWDGTPGNTTIFQQTCSAIIQSGWYGEAIDTSLMLPGDLVLCNYGVESTYMAGLDTGSHVAMWFAPGVMMHVISTYGPNEIDEATITDAVTYWEVRRMPYGS